MDRQQILDDCTKRIREVQGTLNKLKFLSESNKDYQSDASSSLDDAWQYINDIDPDDDEVDGELTEEGIEK